MTGPHAKAVLLGASRHLHETDATHTLCGLGRTQAESVHVTKARLNDCEACRDRTLVTNVAVETWQRTDGALVSRPVIRKFLDLSTAHLPAALKLLGTRDGDPLSWGGAVVVPTDYGFLLWVPDEPLVSAQAEEHDLPDVVLKIQLFARRFGCDYVLFDADGPTCDGLDTWEDAVRS